MTLARLAMYVKVVGQMPEIVFLHHFHCFKVKVKGQGQRSRSNFWCEAVDIRGSALPSAAKSSNHHYQSKVIVCVSVISERMRIIARMRSISF